LEIRDQDKGLRMMYGFLQETNESDWENHLVEMLTLHFDEKTKDVTYHCEKDPDDTIPSLYLMFAAGTLSIYWRNEKMIGTGELNRGENETHRIFGILHPLHPSL
jgi:hypothetical protein